MNRPIKILQAIGGLDRGGIETWMLNIIRRIDRSRYTIDLLVDSTKNYHYNEELRSLGCTVLPCLGYREPYVFWRNLKQIYREHGPYDIVHSQVHHYSGVILSMAAALGVPNRIYHIHPAVADLKPPSFRRALYTSTMRFAISRSATALVACSQTSLRTCQQMYKIRSQIQEVLYNGVSLEGYSQKIDRAGMRSNLGLPTDAPLIVYVARFFPHKNHAQMLRMAKKFESHPRKPHFVCAGSHGPEMESLQIRASEQKNVTVLIGLPDIENLLLASDLFFFPSLEEGFGVVAIEAAAAGLPVIATNLPSIQEAVCPSHQGLMFPPNDDERAATSIQLLLNDPDLRSRMSQDATKWASRFSMDQSVCALTDLYDRIVTTKPRNKHVENMGELTHQNRTTRGGQTASQGSPASTQY